MTSQPPPDRGLRVGWSVVGAVWLVVATVSAVVLRWWQSRGESLPLSSPLLAILMAGVAVVTLLLGLRVRRWVRRGDPVDGMGATHTLVLGQSAALTGAAVAGFETAMFALAIGRADAPEPRTIALNAVLGLLAAAAASVAGMVTQWCCQVPPREDDDDDRPLPG